MSNDPSNVTDFYIIYISGCDFLNTQCHIHKLIIYFIVLIHEKESDLHIVQFKLLKITAIDKNDPKVEQQRV